MQVAESFLVQLIDVVDVTIQIVYHRGLFLSGGGHGEVDFVDLANVLQDSIEPFTGKPGGTDIGVAVTLAFKHGV
ncbi:hypothetical protein [Pseudomonas sp. SMN5]|uniref:hypothetical protein n=1 Tax=Pseudomonas sp. SMN5 TaxID=3390198 RepID=UPI003F874640